MLGSFSNRKRQRDSWSLVGLVAIGFLEACHTAASATSSSKHKVWGVCQARAFSEFNIAKVDNLHWSADPLRKWKLGREWFSHSGHWLTPACLPFLQYWWSIWTGFLHERHINWQDWQDIELAQVLVFFWHGKSCSMLCSFLLWTGTDNMIPGNAGIPESRQTAAATKQSSQNKMWGCLPSSSFFGFNHCKGDTLHWFDPWK